MSSAYDLGHLLLTIGVQHPAACHELHAYSLGHKECVCKPFVEFPWTPQRSQFHTACTTYLYKYTASPCFPLVPLELRV